ncbi:MAG: alpha/beta hydrolase fold protein [Solirubrobacterales bacterium]|nr:alpha/beta hydrolase fold protein [Solirubrobacterales bacterium]
MPTVNENAFPGARGQIQGYQWPGEGQPRYVAVIAHGYGEHARRYDHVAEALNADGAVVYALDHHGHGRSDGERASVADVQDFVTDLGTVIGRTSGKHGLPIVLIGHSMGGLIATRYAQQHPELLAGLVLSGPIVGGNPAFTDLLGLDPIPEIPIDPAALSRDPAVGAAYEADQLVYHGAFRRETLQALVGAVDHVSQDGPIEVPTLWIHGELDQLAPLDRTRAAIDRLRSSSWQEKVYPGARHEIFNETNQDEVLADVVAFAGSIVGARV